MHFGTTAEIGKKKKKTYVVWMFPFPPPTNGTTGTSIDPQEVLICPYSKACPQSLTTTTTTTTTSFDLLSVTNGTLFENFVRDHAYHKIRLMHHFSKHLQVITLLALLGKDANSCVRTLGSAVPILCDHAASPYKSYDPYYDEEDSNANSANFPTELLPEHVLPDMRNTETFAIHGMYPTVKRYQKGKWNSGDDVQYMASAHWLPFVNDIRDRKTSLLNYTGYMIANCLISKQQTPQNSSTLEQMKRISLLSIYSPPDNLDRNLPYLQTYTSKVGEAFGCRSTTTHKELLKRKIPSYFSACLTLTYNMQGAILDYDNVTRPKLNSMPITKPSNNNHQQKKNKIFIVDAVTDKVIPYHIKSQAHYRSANIPKKHPEDMHPYMNRLNYAYRLVSQYANEAKVIITSRIHVGLPAMAMGVPVIFISNNGWLPGGKEATGRVDGLLDLFHRIDASKGDVWRFGDFENIPPNPGNQEADRYRCSFYNRFQRTSSYYADTGKLFGMIPFQRLGRDDMTPHDYNPNFHFLLQDCNVPLPWQSKRAIEHAFVFHPNAQVYVHCLELEAATTIVTRELDIFSDCGYDLRVQPLHVGSIVAENRARLGNLDPRKLSPKMLPFLIL
jgi:hypothetical protein